MRIRNPRRPAAASDATRGHAHRADVKVPVEQATSPILEAPCVNSSFEGPIMRMRNARRLKAAPDATRDHTCRTYIYGHGRPSYRGYIEGPEGVLVVLRAQFCELRNARRLTAAPVVTRGQTHRTNVHGHGRQSYGGYIVGPVCELACSRDLFAKTQCEAPYSRTRRCSLSHTSRTHIRSR